MVSNIKRLSDLGETFQGLNLNRFPIFDESGTTPVFVINPSEITRFGIRTTSSKPLLGNLERDREIFVQNQKHQLQPQDILITTRNRPLRATTTDFYPGEGIFIAGQNVTVFRRKSHELFAPYLALFLNSSAGQNRVEALFSNSSTTPLIRLSDLETLEIPLPPLHTQHQLVNAMNKLATLEDVTQQALIQRRNLLDQAVIAALEE